MASSSTLAAVPDAELDAYIADLIVRKSKAEAGSSVPEDVESSSPPSRVPNTNKRFLASVIRNVEGHNQALLRQQEREAERDARRAERKHAGESSRLRGWSDDEGGPSSPTAKQQVEEGLSSKMDRYFAGSLSDDAGPSSSQERGGRDRKPPSGPSRDKARRSDRRTDRHDKDRDRRHSSKSGSDRHHERRHHSSSRSHKSSHRERDDHDDDSRRRSRRRNEDTRSKSERKENSGRSRKRSASPPRPKQVREWDRGKDSLAF